MVGPDQIVTKSRGLDLCDIRSFVTLTPYRYRIEIRPICTALLRSCVKQTL